MDKRLLARVLTVAGVALAVTCLADSSPTARSSHPHIAPAPLDRGLPLRPIRPPAEDVRRLTSAGIIGDGHDDRRDGAIDLQGNDVMTAVATYKVDDTGALYELHSPRTEVPRLGTPKS